MRTQLFLTVSAMLLATISMAAAAALPQLVVDAPDTFIVGQQIQVTVTANEEPIDEATVFFSLSGSQFQRTTDVYGTATFTPTITENLSVVAVKQGYAQSEETKIAVITGEVQPTATTVASQSSPVLPSHSQSPITTTPTSMPVSSSPAVAPTHAPSPTSMLPPAETATPTTLPGTTTPTPFGFEAVFAIAGLLAVAHLVLRRNRK